MNERMSRLRSKPYNYTVMAERVDFFELMAQLLFYVTFGEAEICCMVNTTNNPLLEVISLKECTDSRINCGVAEFSTTTFIEVKYIFSKKTLMKVSVDL